MEPLISILIPAFNAQAWLADTIRSASAQTWLKKEIIIVDDGSTDGTLAVARQFASASVSVVSQPNQGAAAARNQAFARSQGDYIQWLDADDLLAPDKIATQLAALDGGGSPRTLLSSAWGRFRYRPHRATFTPTSLWSDLLPVEWVLRSLTRNHWMQPATWLVSRELTQAAGLWDTRLSLDDDGEYFCRVVLASCGTRFVPAARVFYRRAVDSLSYVGRSPRKLESQLLSVSLQFDHLRSVEDSDRVRSACLHCLQRYFIYFYPEHPVLVKQATDLAEKLGGRLETPRLPWKYAWIQKTLGWSAAKHVQHSYNRLKTAFLLSLDNALFSLEKLSRT